MDGVDRISQMEDAILEKILIYLPSKECASTCTLSKRWKHLYRKVPVIDVAWESRKYRKQDRENKLNQFYNFVDNMVNLSWPVHKFWVRSDTLIPEYRLGQWMFRVSAPGTVQDFGLTIDVNEYPHVVLPLGLHSLLKLKLGRDFLLNLSPDASFPVLETLELDCIRFAGTRLDKLLLLSPKLTEIIMRSLEWFHWCSSTLSSPSLKKVTVHCLKNKPNIVSFDTPGVEFFDYKDFVARKYGILNFQSLVEAKMNLLLHNNDETNLDASALFEAISHVKRLFLSSTSLRVLYVCVVKPVFYNLLHLTVHGDMDGYWPSLPLLVQNSPNLETLIFKGDVHHFPYDSKKAFSMAKKNKHYKPLIKCLKTCKIKVVELYPLKKQKLTKVLGMVTVFLVTMKFLEQLNLYHHSTNDECDAAFAMAQPRASPSCKFQILPRPRL